MIRPKTQTITVIELSRGYMTTHAATAGAATPWVVSTNTKPVSKLSHVLVS